MKAPLVILLALGVVISLTACEAFSVRFATEEDSEGRGKNVKESSFDVEKTARRELGEDEKPLDYVGHGIDKREADQPAPPRKSERRIMSSTFHLFEEKNFKLKNWLRYQLNRMMSVLVYIAEKDKAKVDYWLQYLEDKVKNASSWAGYSYDYPDFMNGKFTDVEIEGGALQRRSSLPRYRYKILLLKTKNQIQSWIDFTFLKMEGLIQIITEDAPEKVKELWKYVDDNIGVLRSTFQSYPPISLQHTKHRKSLDYDEPPREETSYRRSDNDQDELPPLPPQEGDPPAEAHRSPDEIFKNKPQYGMISYPDGTYNSYKQTNEDSYPDHVHHNHMNSQPGQTPHMDHKFKPHVDSLGSGKEHGWGHEVDPEHHYYQGDTKQDDHTISTYIQGKPERLPVKDTSADDFPPHVHYNKHFAHDEESPPENSRQHVHKMTGMDEDDYDRHQSENIFEDEHEPDGHSVHKTKPNPRDHDHSIQESQHYQGDGYYDFLIDPLSHTALDSKHSHKEEDSKRSKEMDSSFHHSRELNHDYRNKQGPDGLHSFDSVQPKFVSRQDYDEDASPMNRRLHSLRDAFGK